MGRVRDFRDLEVWKRGMELVDLTYRLARSLPRHEQYGLSDQLRRAAVSVPANIAEGHGRQHTKEFLQHLSIARGSLAEVLTLVLIASRVGYLTPEQSSSAEESILAVRRPLWIMIRALERRL